MTFSLPFGIRSGLTPTAFITGTYMRTYSDSIILFPCRKKKWILLALCSFKGTKNSTASYMKEALLALGSLLLLLLLRPPEGVAGRRPSARRLKDG
jgi:hypothetical protein